MSTKTTIKRIALIAATALTLGGFSVISASSANAAVGTMTAIQVSKNTLVGNGVALSAGNYVANTVLDSKGISSFTVTGGDTVTLKIIPINGTLGGNDSISVTMVGYGNLVTNDTAVSGAVSTSVAAGGDAAVFPTAPAGQNYTFTATTVPGSYSLNVIAHPADGSHNDYVATVTMVVSAAAGFSAGLSTTYIGTTSSPDATSDAIAVSASKTAGTTGGYITSTLNKSDGTAISTGLGLTYSADMTGPGYLSLSSGGTPTACSSTPTWSSTVNRSVTSGSGASSVNKLIVCSDGTTGKATVTMYVTDAAGVKTTLASRSVTFYGTAASLSVAASNFSIAKAGASKTTGGTVSTGTTTDSTPAFVILEKDSSGNPVNGGVPTVVSSDVTIIASGSCALDGNDATYGYGPVGYYDCNFTSAPSAVSGKSATLTIKLLDPNKTDGSYLTTTYTVTVGGSVAKEVISTDKTSYAAGENMIATVTATDSSGNPVYDGASSPALSFNKAIGGTAPAAAYYVGGKKANKTNTLFAPSVAGDFLITATGGDAASTPLSASATVVVSGGQDATLALDAANAATDAANNAYDEAQNATQAAQDALAAVTALADQVKSLIASVKSLTALVSKIKAKVGA